MQKDKKQKGKMKKAWNLTVATVTEFVRSLPDLSRMVGVVAVAFAGYILIQQEDSIVINIVGLICAVKAVSELQKEFRRK